MGPEGKGASPAPCGGVEGAQPLLSAVRLLALATASPPTGPPGCGWCFDLAIVVNFSDVTFITFSLYAIVSGLFVVLSLTSRLNVAWFHLHLLLCGLLCNYWPFKIECVSCECVSVSERVSMSLSVSVCGCEWGLLAPGPSLWLFSFLSSRRFAVRAEILCCLQLQIFSACPFNSCNIQM